MDRDKVQKFMGVADRMDCKVDAMMQLIMGQVDMDTHRIVSARRLSNGCRLGVISFGEESFGDDLQMLRKKKIRVPEYLQKLEDALEGPDVYTFVAEA